MEWRWLKKREGEINWGKGSWRYESEGRSGGLIVGVGVEMERLVDDGDADGLTAGSQRAEVRSLSGL